MELDAGTISTPHNEGCVMNTNNGRCLRIRERDTKLYLKSEVDKYIENIVNRTTSMFREPNQCRGLDTKSPVGRIADVAFRHWKIIEQRQLYYETVQNISETRLRRINELKTELKNLYESVAEGCRKAEKQQQELRHNKRKRCLLMADKCNKHSFDFKELFQSTDNEDLEHKYNFKIELYCKWQKRWLELADKFKESK